MEGYLRENKFCLKIGGKQVYAMSKNLLLHFLAIRLKEKKKPTSIAHPRGTTTLHIAVRTAEHHEMTTAL